MSPATIPRLRATARHMTEQAYYLLHHGHEEAARAAHRVARDAERRAFECARAQLHGGRVEEASPVRAQSMARVAGDAAARARLVAAVTRGDDAAILAAEQELREIEAQVTTTEEA